MQDPEAMKYQIGKNQKQQSVKRNCNTNHVVNQKKIKTKKNRDRGVIRPSGSSLKRG